MHVDHSDLWSINWTTHPTRAHWRVLILTHPCDVDDCDGDLEATLNGSNDVIAHCTKNCRATWVRRVDIRAIHRADDRWTAVLREKPIQPEWLEPADIPLCEIVITGHCSGCGLQLTAHHDGEDRWERILNCPRCGTRNSVGGDAATDAVAIFTSKLRNNHTCPLCHNPAPKTSWEGRRSFWCTACRRSLPAPK